MLNLNYIVKRKCESGWGHSKIKFDLDPKIREEYEEKEIVGNLFGGIGNLVDEIQIYRRENKKAITRLMDDNSMILQLLSSGDSLHLDKLSLLNKNYREGRRLYELPEIGGSLMAAYYLAQAGGEISIENCQEGIYTVRNIIKFKPHLEQFKLK